MRASSIGWLLSLTTVAACNSLSGLGDYEVVQTGSGATTATATASSGAGGGAGGTAGSSGRGGGGMAASGGGGTVEPACDDGLHNGEETGEDCGGPMCPPCADGEGCVDATDCESGYCSDQGVCALPSCGDGSANGDETDVDCGGTCPGCSPGQACNVGGDCQTGYCDSGTCEIAASCKVLKDSTPALGDGPYTIDPDGPAGVAAAFEVFCEMTTDGGGWTFLAHVNNNYVGGKLFANDIGVYQSSRIDDNTTYSRGASILPFVGHTAMMVTLDDPDPVAAEAAAKIVFFQYAANHQGFNAGPIPCVGLNAGFSYRIELTGGFTPGGTTNACGNGSWYTRTAGNAAYLVLFTNSGAQGNYWGVGLGGNNTWSHDGYWYVR